MADLLLISRLHPADIRAHRFRALAQKIFVRHSGDEITNDLGAAVGCGVCRRHAVEKPAKNYRPGIVLANIAKIFFKKIFKEFFQFRGMGFYGRV